MTISELRIPKIVNNKNPNSNKFFLFQAPRCSIDLKHGKTGEIIGNMACINGGMRFVKLCEYTLHGIVNSLQDSQE